MSDMTCTKALWHMSEIRALYLNQIFQKRSSLHLPTHVRLIPNKLHLTLSKYMFK